MPEHPIDERTNSHIRKVWWKESPDTRFGFGAGARFGYDAALADMAAQLTAAKSCVEYLRTLADANDFPTASKRLVGAYDDAVKGKDNA